MFALLMVGCDNSTSVDTTSAAGEALFSEESMYKTVTSTDDDLAQMHGEGPVHDSLRHGRMLGHLKVHLGLTDEQFDSVKVYAKSMFLTLKDIRDQVHDSLITREQARELVTAARTQFVASIKLILTEEQLIKLEDWITNFWNRPPHRRHGHRGPGGPDGPGHP